MRRRWSINSTSARRGKDLPKVAAFAVVCVSSFVAAGLDTAISFRITVLGAGYVGFSVFAVLAWTTIAGVSAGLASAVVSGSLIDLAVGGAFGSTSVSLCAAVLVLQLLKYRFLPSRYLSWLASAVLAAGTVWLAGWFLAIILGTLTVVNVPVLVALPLRVAFIVVLASALYPAIREASQQGL